jgi:DNA-binding NarL/FixJ family response regulator
VRAVALGDALVSPAITQRLLTSFVSGPRPGARAAAGLEELTERELDVLLLVAHGLSNREVGERLFIGEATVRTHLTHVFAKLGVRDRVQAVVLAHESGLVSRARTS